MTIPDLNRDMNSRGGNTDRQILSRQNWHFDPFFRSQSPTTTPASSQPTTRRSLHISSTLWRITSSANGRN